MLLFVDVDVDVGGSEDVEDECGTMELLTVRVAGALVFVDDIEVEEEEEEGVVVVFEVEALVELEELEDENEGKPLFILLSIDGGGGLFGGVGVATLYTSSAEGAEGAIAVPVPVLVDDTF